ncbi:hypothetical protein [Anaerospora hongkongensis]|uniref:hypothetical protein n=1 Tax=Anaerospora hongkongensis TaxID=244830 RepID=UPI00289E8A41|nr:hypothetical protein [Anaerospora hongkongensis]
MPHCNQTDCRYCDAAKLLCQTEAYLVDRLCITFKRRPRGENYRDLMRVQSPNCHKNGGGKYKSNRIGLIK